MTDKTLFAVELDKHDQERIREYRPISDNFHSRVLQQLKDQLPEPLTPGFYYEVTSELTGNRIVRYWDGEFWRQGPRGMTAHNVYAGDPKPMVYAR